MITINVIRIQKDENNPYVMINKLLLNDKNLSWQAKGMMAYLLSLPDDWEIYETEIQTHSKNGIKYTRSCIKELINNGYIQRSKTRQKGKFTGYEYIIIEAPTVMPKTANGKRHTTNNNITNNNKHSKKVGLNKLTCADIEVLSKVEGFK